MIRIELVRQNLAALADELLEKGGHISDWELLEVAAQRAEDQHLEVEFYRRDHSRKDNRPIEIIYTPREILICIKAEIECRAKPKED